MNEMQTSDLQQDDDPKTINDCLKSNGLTWIMGRVSQINRADQAIQQVLPADLAKHCHVINITQQQLVIAADSAAWATRIRYAAPDILTAFQQLKLPFAITSIKCRVG